MFTKSLKFMKPTVFILETEQRKLKIFLIVSELNFSFSHFEPINNRASLHNKPLEMAAATKHAWQYFGYVIV